MHATLTALENNVAHHVLHELVHRAVTMFSLIAADAAVAAVLISVGAVLGKTSPLQLLLMGVIETAVYAANEYFAHNKLQVLQLYNYTVLLDKLLTFMCASLHSALYS